MLPCARPPAAFRGGPGAVGIYFMYTVSMGDSGPQMLVNTF